MDKALFVQLVVALIGCLQFGQLIRFFWKRMRPDPKALAEARKIAAEAARIEWAALHDEIGRLNRQTKQLRNEIQALKNKLASREDELLQENARLHAEVNRLTRRVEGLESILKITPLPEDMKELLAQIDEKTAVKPKRGK